MSNKDDGKKLVGTLALAMFTQSQNMQQESENGRLKELKNIMGSLRPIVNDIQECFPDSKKADWIVQDLIRVHKDVVAMVKRQEYICGLHEKNT